MEEDISEVDEVIDKLSGPGWLVMHCYYCTILTFRSG